jgi:hypothetical protein
VEPRHDVLDVTPDDRVVARHLGPGDPGLASVQTGPRAEERRADPAEDLDLAAQLR